MGRKKKDDKNKEKILGFEVIRLDIRDMQKDEAKFCMTKSNLNTAKIKIRSSEVVRIVNCFDPDNCGKDGSKYLYMKGLVILKIGKAYNKYYQCLCETPKAKKKNIGEFTLEIIQIDENKNQTILETIRYKRLLCGSSFVRNAKEMYVREELYDKVMEVLLTGIKPDARFSVDKVAKYSTYLGLAATDSVSVSMPNICVVKDFRKKVKDEFDIVRQMKGENGSFKYEVTNYVDTKEMTEEEVNCFDGAGIVSYERAVIWAKELGLDYVPASFQIRVLNGIKGNLYTFPVTEYMEYLEENHFQDHLVIQDLWGTSVNIKEQNIDVFLTESQFKFHALYHSFSEWKSAFEIEVEYKGHSYKRTFNISEVSKNVDKLKDELWSAYQPLQTLDFTDGELEELTQPTVSMVRSLYTDINEFTKYRGIAIESDMEETSSSSGSSSSSPSPSTSSSGNSGSSGGNSSWGSWFVKKTDSYPKSKLNKDTSIVDRLKYLDIDSSFSRRASYYSAMGGSGTYTGSNAQNSWMLSQMKSHGYRKGTKNASAGNHWTQEDGEELIVRKSDGAVLTPLHSGDAVLNPEASRLLSEFTSDSDRFLNQHISGMALSPIYPKGFQDNNQAVRNPSSQNVGIENINLNLELPNVTNYTDFRNKLIKDSSFEKAMFCSINHAITGKGTPLDKLKYAK